MIGGIYTAQTAMSMFESALNNSANNLANVNTTGFKRSFIDFQDLSYTGSDNKQVGYGGRFSAITTRDFQQGPAVVTDNSLDMMIAGKGLFSVMLANGETAYTRDGSFHLDSTGRIVNSDGFVLQPGITVPADTTKIEISANGTVSVLRGDSDIPQVVGQFQLTRFVNEAGLSSLGRNLLQETAASGAPITGNPGTEAFGAIRQGAVEGSNVEVATELTELISAQRAFSVNSRAFTVTSQMLDTAFQIIR